MIEPTLARKAFVKHHFLNEDFIHGVIERAIQTQRIRWVDREHFTVKARRKTDGKFVHVIVWVHDREDCYWVGKVHVESIK